MKTNAVKISSKNLSILQEIADSQNNTIEFVANETIENYYEDLRQWRIAKIKKAIEQIDNGQTVSHEEMQAIFNKYKNKNK
ncbi:MAG: hypothetical protein LBQ34_07285 [Alphaproteobacteria bacterium]|jgi:predicted transcriptional regulator|nr:hypothetical protein [Alphaproteobacteria bacterium]